MPPVFTSLFAERLNKVSPFEVLEACGGEVLEPGKVYITPGGLHAVLDQQGGHPVLRLVPKKESDLYCPSVNMLFLSAARLFRERTLAVLLTGMGDDGAEGMLEIKKAGGFCIAESMESAIIFGMPGEAVRLGAADQVLPSWQIPAALMQLLQKKQ
jgi:two-component system chemotaxis response regulator CheB